MVNPLSIFDSAGNQPAAMGALRQKAEELEGVFLSTLTKQMVSGLNAKGAFGGGFAEETWRSMQAEQFASSISQAGGIGLADELVRSLIELQQATNQGTTP